MQGSQCGFAVKVLEVVLRTHNLIYFSFLVLSNFLKSKNKQICMLRATEKQKLFLIG